MATFTVLSPIDLVPFYFSFSLLLSQPDLESVLQKQLIGNRIAPIVPQFIPPSELFSINLPLLQITFILNRKGFYTNCTLYKPSLCLEQSNTLRTSERLTHIASLALFPSTEIVFTLKSTPREGKIF